MWYNVINQIVIKYYTKNVYNCDQYQIPTTRLNIAAF